AGPYCTLPRSWRASRHRTLVPNVEVDPVPRRMAGGVVVRQYGKSFRLVGELRTIPADTGPGAVALAGPWIVKTHLRHRRNGAAQASINQNLFILLSIRLIFGFRAPYCPPLPAANCTRNRAA